MAARKKRAKKTGRERYIADLLKTVKLLYKFYLTTPHWQRVRKAALVLAHYQCQECGGSKRLEVHHLHYRTLGREDPARDLQVLCRGCHKDAHKKS